MRERDEGPDDFDGDDLDGEDLGEEGFEAWDRTWKLPWRKLDEGAMRRAAEDVASQFQGVSVKVVWEEDDCVTAFFTVPAEAESAEHTREVEVSAYSLGGDGVVLSLEVDAADNELCWEDAERLAEDLADALDAGPLDL
ncbi:MAG: hypothetical protein H6742_22170 [Alphaproteobacteria bacterium]|nr:hypothetical protein [Alphaproteobacteria bacterium]